MGAIDHAPQIFLRAFSGARFLTFTVFLVIRWYFEGKATLEIVTSSEFLPTGRFIVLLCFQTPTSL
jgi:hypothetical protein